MSERFDDDELRAAYVRVGATDTTRGAECPTPESLAAAVRGEWTGSDAERLHVLDHAMRCAACRPEAALLHALGAPPRRGVAMRDRVWPVNRRATLAAAATVLVAVGLYGANRGQRATRADDLTRGTVDGDLALVAPASAAAGTSDSIAFVWRSVAGAFRYTLEVDAADGSVLYTATTVDTALVAPLGGVPRGEHRWSVRARLDDGSERHSESRPLRLR